MRFWDASGLVPLLVQQARSRDVQTLLSRDSHVVAWWGTQVECLSALLRMVREGHLDQGQLTQAERRLDTLRQSWDEVLPTEACRRTAERMLRVHALRSADSFQLAAALIASDHDPARIEFVCLDQRLVEAGRKEGFVDPLMPHRPAPPESGQR